MAITVTNNLTTLATADSGAGETWYEGTSAVTTYDAELLVHGTDSMSFTVRNQTSYCVAAVSNIDLTNQHIYGWILTTAGKFLGTTTGIEIYVESSAGNWAAWQVADLNSYPGGWQCYVAYTGDTPTASGGTVNMTSITRVGFRVEVGGARNAVNVWIDVLRYGNNGLTVTGGTDPDAAGDAGDWEELYQQDVNSSNAYGIISKVNGVYYLQGPLTFGDTGSGNNWFRDTSKIVVFKDASVSSTLYKITVAGGTGNNEFRLGSKAGTAGVNGCIITAAGTQTWVFDATDTDINNLELYGCTFGNCSSFLLPVDATGREALNCSWNSCGPIEPSTCLVENFTVSNATSDAVIIASTSHQFNYGSLINSTDAGVYIASAGSYDFYGVKCINNTYDVQNNSTGTVTINNLDLSDFTTYNNTNGGTTSIVTAVTLTVRGVKTGSEPTNYVRVRVEKTSDGSEILNASASTTDDLNAGYYKYSVSYNYPGTAVPVIVKARYKGYIPFTTSGTITENGLDITAVWLADPNFTP